MAKTNTTKKWTNLEIARLLRKMAAAYTVLGENRFKIIAYDNAATAVEHATSELHDLWEENKLESIPGLGASIAGHLEELFNIGRSKHFDQILSRVNPAIFPLLEVPGIGPKKAQKLVEKLGIKGDQEAISKVETAAKEHKITSIPDFGEKSEQDILENIERYRKGAIKEVRMVLPQADLIAEEILDYIREIRGIGEIRVDKLGSLRREVATIGDIDLAVATHNPEKVIERFVNYPKKTGIIEKGPTGASILLASGRQADLRVAKPDEYGAMLQYFTGSKYHNIALRDYALKKGWSLSEYGIKDVKGSRGSEGNKGIHKFRTEEEFYKFLGMEWIPPELREDNGEVQAALKHMLPNLAELKDIKGDLQLHSDFDQETSHDSGVNSIREIKEAGERLGYEYVAITNHNPSSSKHNIDEIIGKMIKQRQYIEQLNSSTKGTRVLSLLEVDIQPDGTLPVPQKGLELLDGCLVSIHSNFGMVKEKMTERIIKGLSNPKAKILAHPTGRLLGEREGIEADWKKIMEYCLKDDKAMEINAYPNRLDLPDVLVREAVKMGVKLSIGTDSHVVSDMVNMKYGVVVARRGWAETKDIINTWSYNKLSKWLKEEKR